MQNWLVTAIVVGLFGFVQALATAADKLQDELVRTLKAKDFWETAGRKDARMWTGTEQGQLRVLQAESTDPVVRLRANKLLVDLAGAGRTNGKDDDAKVVDCFRYLETHISDGPVNKLCSNEGFTHYSGPDRSGGTFLIEHVSPGFNGGINLKRDDAKKGVGEVKTWGDVGK